MAFDFKAIQTGDGSPSLSLPPTWEAMHALEGAFTETQYIYQPTVEKAFKAVDMPGFLSVGLGLGYNEILIICEALKLNRQPAFIESYESVDDLRECFRNWIFGLASPLNEIYDQILHLYAEKYSQPAIKIKTLLKDMTEENGLKFRTAIDAATVPPPSNGILFDAFSSKTSPELWTPEFLENFFKLAAADTCFVSTYASMGNLKRALTANGFVIETIKGFGKKRESTFASKTSS